MWTNFVDKIEETQQKNRSQLALLISPKLHQMPLPIQRYDDPFLPFSKSVINASQDLVCTYLFDFPAYLTLGAAGAVALERSIAYVRHRVPTILHGNFASTSYSDIVGETGFHVDGVTVAFDHLLSHYLNNPPFAGFIVKEGKVKTGALLAQGGHLWTERETLSYHSGGVMTYIRVLGDSVIYGDSGNNFADDIHQQLEKLRT